MKKWIIIVIIVVLVILLGSCNNDKLTTYYQDYNDNGECDLGEAAWDEDDDGNIVHIFD